MNRVFALHIIIKLYRMMVHRLWEPVGHVAGRYYLEACGAVCGSGIKTYGFPITGFSRGSVVKIGNDVVLRSKSYGNAIGVNHEVVLRTMTQHASLIIGNRVGISGGAICAAASVEIGNDVLLGANVVIADNDFHGIKLEDRHLPTDALPAKPIKIEDGVWIGADAYICKGVTIGKNSVIGAKSVVTKSVPADCIAAGVPARVISVIERKTP